MFIYQHSPDTDEYRALFDPVGGAEVIEAPDNAISMLGLSDRELVIAFLGVESYRHCCLYKILVPKQAASRYHQSIQTAQKFSLLPPLSTSAYCWLCSIP
jgi:hypothetical protein